MAVYEGKKYKLESSENFDEYMKAVGVGMVLRKVGNSTNPTVELSKNGDTYTFTTITPLKTSSISFKLGEEFEEDTLDGRKVRSIITLDGNKFIQEQKGDKPTTIVREFTDSKLITTLTIGDVVATRNYVAA